MASSRNPPRDEAERLVSHPPRDVDALEGVEAGEHAGAGHAPEHEQLITV